MSGASAEDQFVRGYFEDVDKIGFVVDVRDNRGGSIDSWLLDVFSKKAWMWWQSRCAACGERGGAQRVRW
jgi:tricorn protease